MAQILSTFQQTTQGLITVEAKTSTVFVDSPVPVVVDLAGQPPRLLAAGRHEVSLY